MPQIGNNQVCATQGAHGACGYGWIIELRGVEWGLEHLFVSHFRSSCEFLPCPFICKRSANAVLFCVLCIGSCWHEGFLGQLKCWLHLHSHWWLLERWSSLLVKLVMVVTRWTWTTLLFSGNWRCIASFTCRGTDIKKVHSPHIGYPHWLSCSIVTQ